MAAFPFFSTRNPVRAKSEARQPSSQSPAAIAAEPAAEARTAHTPGRCNASVSHEQSRSAIALGRLQKTPCNSLIARC